MNLTSNHIMKNIYFLMILSFTSTLCLSQEYSPIVENGKEFSIAMFSGGNPNPSHSYYEIIGEDTLINSVLYKKLYETEMDVEYSPTTNLIGFIMETKERQVILRDLDDNQGLIYDFYVEQGDTIDFYNPFLRSFYESFFPSLGADTVAIVDTVYYTEINGVNRKCYTVSAYGEMGTSPLLFIEGIGSVVGIRYAGMNHFFGPVGAEFCILCAYNSSEVIYNNPLYSYCFYTGINNVHVASQLNVYPNPCKDKVTINNSSKNEFALQIINYNGTVLFESFITDYTTIDMQHLSAGIYILKAISDDEILFFKVLKQ